MSRRKAIEARRAMENSRSAPEVRLDVRNYIQNERDTILRKWMALEEAVKSEDFRRDQFHRRKLREDTKTLPLSIMKFIGTLKKSVRVTMRDKGGTPFSIIRHMFLYWDADKSGEMSADELEGAMNSLGVKMTAAERDEVVEYYDSGKGMNEMNYDELLQDIMIGEPTIIGDSTHLSNDNSDILVRYEDAADIRPPKTKTIDQFLEATRYWVMFRMRVEGGTPYYHIRYLFQFYDYDYSNGLNADELMIATKKGMKLTITRPAAEEIVKYYDYTGNGDMRYQEFLADVATFVKPVLHFTDVTPEERAAYIESINRNPFMPKAFKAPPNKILELFKKRMGQALADKVNFTGGTVTQWLREAFIYWDRDYTKRLGDWRVLQGVAKRVHVEVNQEECETIMKNYDKWGTGEMHWEELLKDMEEEEGDFLREPEGDQTPQPTQRTPTNVTNNVRRFKACVETYSRKSEYSLSARDLLHGTFLRFDASGEGRVGVNSVAAVAEELGVTLTRKEITELVLWFDTCGSRELDYNALTDQMFGAADVMTRKMTLPRLSKHAGSASFNVTKTYKGNGAFSEGGQEATLSKKTMLVESNKRKMERLSLKRQSVLQEKRDVRDKLRSIDEQQEKLIAAYKSRHKEAREALKRPPPQIFGVSKAPAKGKGGNTATLQSSLSMNQTVE